MCSFTDSIGHARHAHTDRRSQVNYRRWIVFSNVVQDIPTDYELNATPHRATSCILTSKYDIMSDVEFLDSHLAESNTAQL